MVRTAGTCGRRGTTCTCGEHLAGDGDAENGRPPRKVESTARPLGEKTFLEKIGALLARDLVSKKPGRKAKGRK